MIGKLVRAHARSLTGDIVLLWVTAASFAMSLSLATSIPSEYADATGHVREALAGPFGAVLATYGAVLAAVYGSFRYTVDRRDGVIAQRLMLGPRWAWLLVRASSSAIGGAIVAGAAIGGGQLALAITMGGLPFGSDLGSTIALGALAGLWGMAVGIVVQAHLVALFAASFSMGMAAVVALFWKAGAVYLPLLAMLEAFRFDVSAIGIMPGESIQAPGAVLMTVGWLLLAGSAAAVSFLHRDVK